MPSLRSRAEAIELKIVFQPLFDDPYAMRGPHVEVDAARREDANVPEPVVSKSGRPAARG
jgi:hypothetical protein